MTILVILFPNSTKWCSAKWCPNIFGGKMRKSSIKLSLFRVSDCVVTDSGFVLLGSCHNSSLLPPKFKILLCPKPYYLHVCANLQLYYVVVYVISQIKIYVILIYDNYKRNLINQILNVKNDCLSLIKRSTPFHLKVWKYCAVRPFWLTLWIIMALITNNMIG